MARYILNIVRPHDEDIEYGCARLRDAILVARDKTKDHGEWWEVLDNRTGEIVASRENH